MIIIAGTSRARPFDAAPNRGTARINLPTTATSTIVFFFAAASSCAHCVYYYYYCYYRHRRMYILSSVYYPFLARSEGAPPRRCT